MAPRRGAVESPEPEPSTSLAFNEPLSWRAGKPIATATLLDRLKRLASELRDMDQEEVDKSSLTDVAKELAAQNLLNHKDNGVKAWTACCLVDILKLCAPDAPYTGTQVKNIFTLFITSILPALSNPGHGYNAEHKYVLSSLAEVKSIVLLTDVPNNEDLMLHLFSSFFDITSGSSKSSTGDQVSKDVQYNMMNILVTLVDEAQILAPQVIDIIVAQFLRAGTPGGGKTRHDSKADQKQSTLLLKDLPEAYNIAKTICNNCPEKMSRYISQYFNEVMLEFSQNGGGKSNGHRRGNDDGDSDEEEDDAPSGPSDADLRELHKAHRLLRELWRASPAVLQNVIPQVEAELSAENVQLRLLATETLGDIISGIGAAGPPPLPNMDPAAYPPQKLEDFAATPISTNILTTPSSPQSFSQTHPSVYHSFISRKNDKSPVIRSGWTTAIGRILVTSAGGIGLNRDDETALVKSLAEKLNDADEKVRVAAVKAVQSFSLNDIMTKLAPNGPINKSGSVLSNLGDRVRDKKHIVRIEAMTTMGTIWGVASGEIAAGNESVMSSLGAIPSRIFDAFFTNDLEVNVLLDHVTFEQLLPLNYPPTKSKAKAANGSSQSQSQANIDEPYDADRIRVERVLLLVRDLDPKAKKAFFAISARQKTYSEVLTLFLKKCEEFNGGVMDDNAADIKQKLDVMIDYLKTFFPDPMRTSQEFHKYAKMHDRRSYQLLRFTMDPKSDFKTVHNAMKEFSKRIEASPNAPAGLLDTFTPLMYRSAILLYNRSHLPAILQIARTDDKGLGAVAQQLMNEISEKSPQVLTENIKELCKALEDAAPSKTSSGDPGAVATLKTCAVFAKSKSGPKSLPKDRKFVNTLVNYATYGSPPRAAKYAITLLLTATDKKEMHTKDLLEKSIQGWKYGEDHYLTKLAAISQLQLLGSKIAEDFNDEILEITIQNVLFQVRTTAKDSDSSWQSDAELDEECQAKCWALKILANRLRTVEDKDLAKTVAEPVYKLFNTLISNNGELSKKKDTPKHHKTRLRLLAAQLMLKLCTIPVFDDLLQPAQFDNLAFVAQDSLFQVRKGFVDKLQKYLVKDKLSERFYTLIFITAFEPDIAFKNSIVTWIKSRAKGFAQNKKTTMEKALPRLLSLLAHHPDYSPEKEDLEDHARYILYYVSNIATQDNLGLLYKFAQTVKQARDAINPAESDNLYVLSDLTQSIISKWELKKGWTMQLFTSKVRVPAKLFSALPSHEVAQEIANKTYLPDEIEERLDVIIRNIDRKKVPISHKRKSMDDGSLPAAKKQKSGSKSHAKKPKQAKTPKTKSFKAPRTPAISSAERRKSGRGASAKKSYADRDDSEDDEEMMDGVAEWEYYDEDGNPKTPEPVEDDESDEELSDAPDVEEANGDDTGEAAEDDPKSREATNDEGSDVEMAEEPSSPKRTAKSAKATRKKVVVDEVDNEDVEMEEDKTPPKKVTKSTRGRRVSSRKSEPEPESDKEDTPVQEEVEPESEKEEPAPPKRVTKARGRNARQPDPEPEPEIEKEDTPEEVPVVEKEPTPPPKRATKATRGKKAAKEPSPEPEPEVDEEIPDVVLESEHEATPPPPKQATRAARGRKASAKKPSPEPEAEAEASEKEDEVDEEAAKEVTPPPKPATKASRARRGAAKKAEPAEPEQSEKEDSPLSETAAEAENGEEEDAEVEATEPESSGKKSRGGRKASGPLAARPKGDASREALKPEAAATRNTRANRRAK